MGKQVKAKVKLQIPGGQLRSPQTSRTVAIPTPTGALSQAYEYVFTGNAEAPQTTHSVVVDLTHGDSNRIFNAQAIDFQGNESRTASVLVGEASRICQ